VSSKVNGQWGFWGGGITFRQTDSNHFIKTPFTDVIAKNGEMGKERLPSTELQTIEIALTGQPFTAASQSQVPHLSGPMTVDLSSLS
jgi:hypothetical protein